MSPTNRGTKLRVLLVEDHPTNQYMVARSLRRAGFDVLVASDGEEALEKTLQDKPDLVLMDLGLPGMDGFEATRRIRQRGAVCRIPIIALTAFVGAEDRDKAMNAGCDDYVTKPIRMSELLSRIAALTPRIG